MIKIRYDLILTSDGKSVCREERIPESNRFYSYFYDFFISMFVCYRYVCCQEYFNKLHAEEARYINSDYFLILLTLSGTIIPKEYK